MSAQRTQSSPREVDVGASSPRDAQVGQKSSLECATTRMCGFVALLTTLVSATALVFVCAKEEHFIVRGKQLKELLITGKEVDLREMSWGTSSSWGQDVCGRCRGGRVRRGLHDSWGQDICGRCRGGGVYPGDLTLHVIRILHLTSTYFISRPHTSPHVHILHVRTSSNPVVILHEEDVSCREDVVGAGHLRETFPARRVL